jgi:hypothetical protein
MVKHKALRLAIWASLLFDATIVLSLTYKTYRYGVTGLAHWFLHVHLEPVSSSGSEAIFRLRPDYNFTAFYLSVILGAFALTAFLLRVNAKRRGGT